MIIDRIYEQALAGGGATFSVLLQDFAYSGYAVSMYPYAEQKQQLTRLNIEFYVSEHYALLRKPGNAVGLWFNAEDNEWYFDVTRVVISRSEAHRVAVQTKQIAYYDLNNQEEIRL